MALRRKSEEIEALVQEYRASGMTQIEYCQQADICRSSLCRYLRGRRGGQRLVRVKVKAPEGYEQGRGFTLVLSNGRRIECGWTFGESELARLIRVAEGI